MPVSHFLTPPVNHMTATLQPKKIQILSPPNFLNEALGKEVSYPTTVVYNP